jgi:Family of unknown function (DUF6152)
MRLQKVTMFAALLLFGLNAFAHHGTFVSYDATKMFTTKATVTEFRFTNPHIQLFFDIKDDKGEVTHWSAEGPDPAVLVAVGWGKKKTMNALAPGTEIMITIQPARNGKPVAEMNHIVLPNGDSVCGMGGAAKAPNCAGAAAEAAAETK